MVIKSRKRNAYKFLVRKPERKRTLGRPKSRCEDNTGMDLREIGWRVVNWIHWLRTGTSSQLL
jgi:hypothetical protein